MTHIRSPIVSVLGHVDHGKSSVLDAIRDTNILATEAGAITQAIGASIVPAEVLQKKCGPLLEKLGVKLTIPGLLFIDTPGHAAFTSLRKRGGNLADIAVVVVDINEGFKPQTIEAIEILRAAKTPFIIVANKIDNITGFRVDATQPILGSIARQDAKIQQIIETKMYEIVGQLHEHFGLTSERFDRVSDFTSQVAIIPISALKQAGISEVLMVLGALAQKYLEKNLLLDESGPAKGTILEVKTEQGLGKTMDVIIYNGTLNVNDTVVFGGLDNAIITKVKAMFEPAPLSEMRDSKSAYTPVKQVVAATGVKLSCPDSEDIISGMPLVSCEKTPEAIEQASRYVQEQVDAVLVETKEKGIIIKADNIGSLEALHVLLHEKGIHVRKAGVGPISKKDITEAESNYEEDPLTAIILGFNIPQAPSSDRVKVITSNIIYHLIDQFEEWRNDEEKKLIAQKLEGLTKPAKIEVLANCIFRQSNPCVLGVEIIEGTLRTGMQLIKANGNKLSFIKEIQLNKENVKEVGKGKQVAVAIPNVTAGRQVHEGDIIYSDVSPPDYREFKKNANLLSGEEKELLKEIAEIKRKEDPFWGK
ncbi:MAG: translation initiation factor IF-2 [Nanoarchaeota archaeon]|nr:translation initiation factor IF-2 [Nanoarchaeota archaeon]